MSNNTYEAMMAQYKARTEKKQFTPKVEYNQKNYFTPTNMEKGVNTIKRRVRILPTKDGSSPFVEVNVHKKKLDGSKTPSTYICPNYMNGSPCPFCEVHSETEELINENKGNQFVVINESTRMTIDELKEIAKENKAKLTYVVKVIDRDNEADGVKFWRFNHDWTQKGIWDKIMSLASDKESDLTDRDLTLTVTRDQMGIPVVISITDKDPSPLNHDNEVAESWLNDERTWRDVYGVKSYDYLTIAAGGTTPQWNKELNKYVAKDGGYTPPAQVQKPMYEDVDMEDLEPSNVTTPQSAEIQEDIYGDLPF